MVNPQLASLMKAFSDEKNTSSPYPWVESISDNGNTLIIRDVHTEDPETQKIRFDFLLGDGTKLTDQVNSKFYSLALEYIEVFQVLSPDPTAKTTEQRMRSLFYFISWLKRRSVRKLESVTMAHIRKYSKDVSSGMESLLDLPQRVHSAIQAALRDNDELLRDGSRKNKIKRSGITEKYNVLNDSHIGGSRPLMKQVFDFYQNEINAGTSYKKLSQLKYQDLEEVLVLPKKLTSTSVLRHLSPIEEIYFWRDYIRVTNFKFNPFPEGGAKLANVLGSEVGRTPSLHPDVAIPYLTEAARWVEDCSDDIIDIYLNERSREHVDNCLKDLKIDLSMTRNYELRAYASHSFKSASRIGLVRLLATACFLVITGLTARRSDEVCELNAGCCDNCWLTIYINKTLQRNDAQPVPPLVQRAVRVLEKLSEKARLTNSNEKLFQILDENNDVMRFDPSSYMTKFYYVTVYDAVGIDWKFSPHQLRRFFALLYFHRFDNSKIGILSYHLRHFSIEMTKRYVTDEEFRKEMRIVGKEWSATFLREVTSGKRSLGGKAGDRIKRKIIDLKHRLRSIVDVVEPDFVVEKLLKYMDRMGVPFTQHFWGTICVCPTKTSLATHAACKTSASTPDYANADEVACGTCPFACFTDRYSSFVRKKLDDERRNIEAAGEESIWKEKSEIRFISLQKLLSTASSIEPLLVE